MSVVESVEQALVSSGVLSPGDKGLVAVSGGVDSMVLLEVLARMAADQQWELAVAHFNHQLRGSESDADEAFVKGVAAARGWETVCGTEDVSGRSREQGVSVEMAAREARHRFLAAAAEERGIGKVLLAHHGDDQAELFFLRLLRGAGSDGLGGMKAVSASPYSASVRLVRPLLGCSKRLLLAFAKKAGVSFREDASNESRDLLRNRVRHELLPLLQSEFSEGFFASLGRTMEVLGAEHEFIEAEARRWLEGTDAFGVTFDLLAVALQREVIRLQLLRRQVVPEFRLIETLRRRAPNDRITVPGGRWFSRGADGRLSECFPESTGFRDGVLVVDLSSTAGSVCFDGLKWEWACMDGGAPMNVKASPEGEEWFDADSVGEEIILRHWRPGDRFQPIGMAHSVKLQDWFTNEKVPFAERRARVLAEAADGRIFWVENMRIGEPFRLKSDTRRVLKTGWQREGKI